MGPATGRNMDLPDMSSMTARACSHCGEPIAPKARIDRTTCSPACRTRQYRKRLNARDGSVTPSGSVAARSDAPTGKEALGILNGAAGVSCEADRAASLARARRTRRPSDATAVGRPEQLGFWQRSTGLRDLTGAKQ